MSQVKILAWWGRPIPYSKSTRQSCSSLFGGVKMKSSRWVTPGGKEVDPYLPKLTDNLKLGTYRQLGYKGSSSPGDAMGFVVQNKTGQWHAYEVDWRYVVVEIENSPFNSKLVAMKAVRNKAEVRQNEACIVVRRTYGKDETIRMS